MVEQFQATTPRAASEGDIFGLTTAGKQRVEDMMGNPENDNDTVLYTLEEHGPASPHRVATKAELRLQKVREILAQMEARGYVSRVTGMPMPEAGD